MRFQPHRLVSPEQFRRRIERLNGLPLRAPTARHVLNSLTEEPQDVADLLPDAADFSKVGDLDPAWVLNRLKWDRPNDPLGLIADSSWWPRASECEGLTRLWRHAAAVSFTARRLAREAGDPDPDRLARVGFLHGLGRWVIAAVDPGWLTDWLAEADPRLRLERELQTLGTDLATLGRELAERWGCDPLLADAAWLHGDGDRGLARAGSSPDQLALIQEAFAWAERTPWSMGNSPVREPTTDPRLRVLIAEVQVSCPSAFVDPEATQSEERLARSNARLRLQLARLRNEGAAASRFLQIFSEWQPSDGPEVWAERAGEAWCGEPGVSAARVVWTGSQATGGVGSATSENVRAHPELPPARILTLPHHGGIAAEVHLWGAGAVRFDPEAHPAWNAWRTWAELVSDRSRLATRLETVVRTYRSFHDDEAPRMLRAKLEALAEFAAGAGHELNNPLAVILGRAQLLLSQETEPGAIRSLRAILGQAQRAHRILRDLMYVARPPEPRPRFCQPEEIVRNCLRDFKAEAEFRGLRLTAEGGEGFPKVWADHDALRHLLETLVRNALEATARGGKVQISTAGNAQALRWTVQDNGRGIDPNEGRHLFDPFFCGRQAGRGLGLGLPRAARFVAQIGGDLRWHAAPGQGSIFQVHIPLGAPPQPLQAGPAAAVAVPRADG